MNKLLALFALLAVFSFPALAQETPILQVGGGYTFRSFNVPFSPRLDMNGWNVTADYSINRWLAVAADIDGTYKSQPDTVVTGTDHTDIYSYLFGPRIYPLGHHKLTPFVHALFGAGHSKITIPGSPDLTETDFAFAIGGGLDLALGKHFALRVAKLDYEQTRFYQSFAPGTPNQNNFKYSAALLVKLGSK